VKDVTKAERRSVGRAADISVLDLDPALGAGIEQDEWQKARRVCRGRVVRLARGMCDPSAAFGDVQNILASVIVDGLVWREVAVLDHALIELLGPGDVLQVTVADGSPRLGPWTTVIASARTDLVVLDDSFVRAAARWPTLLVAVGARLEQQRERLAVQGLISHLSRAEHRLLLMLWHLAQRWGYRSPQGTVLGLRLTHDLLGLVIAAQRPTVTVAAGVLESRGLIGRLDDRSWLLTPMGERAVEEILARRATTISRGEEFVLDMILSETRDQARAVRAVRAQSAQARAAARRDSRLNGQSGRQRSIS
jgi:CRP/FNR family transcriptional regulator, cyclic AMP receptor protein